MAKFGEGERPRSSAASARRARSRSRSSSRARASTSATSASTCATTSSPTSSATVPSSSSTSSRSPARSPRSSTTSSSARTEAKKILSVAVYNHYKRIQAGPLHDDDVEVAKSNILLLGPTGCGKTLLAQTLARMLNVPFAIADATALTEAGYVGEDVENILLKLLPAADFDVKRAETRHHLHRRDRQDRAQEPRTRRSRATSRARASSRRCSRSSRAPSPACRPRAGASTRTRSSSRSTRRTSCSSAAARSPGSRRSSSAASARSRWASTRRSSRDRARRRSSSSATSLPEDLIKFGLIPEFIGRLPVVGAVQQLDRDMLIRMLTEPKNSLVKQFPRSSRWTASSWSSSSDALDAIADQALERGTGARGLRSILEDVLLESMYDVPGRSDVARCVVDRRSYASASTPRSCPRLRDARRRRRARRAS